MINLLSACKAERQANRERMAVLRESLDALHNRQHTLGEETSWFRHELAMVKKRTVVEGGELEATQFALGGERRQIAAIVEEKTRLAALAKQKKLEVQGSVKSLAADVAGVSSFFASEHAAFKAAYEAAPAEAARLKHGLCVLEGEGERQ